MRWGHLGLLVALVVVTPALARLYLWLRGAPRIYERPEEVPAQPVALILGAGLRADGSPTAVLADRVRAGVELYRLGKVKALLLSGDGRSSPYHNEPEAMRRLALRLGVPEEALRVDPEGMRTLASCRRAREVFGFTRAVVVTQRFHLDRALWLCDAAGIEAVGLVADRSPYGPRQLWWTVREIPASLSALAEGLLLRLGRKDSR
ncbi:SanA/YdcF family protein [Thermoflexus sp.]|uniref:SanA/YdcF family protein n=1 Tax=Thermoflexus sp. TaxID=1969742 RepID=UPI002ADD8FF8|nr:ElyC/SanA/YdcF family protein [Thermoflexus sp.]